MTTTTLRGGGHHHHPGWGLAARQWGAVARSLREVPLGHSVEVAREAIAHPADAGAVQSIGLPVGQLSDWRFPPRSDGSGVHVQDFGQAGWRAHVDAVHPATSLSGHLIRDVFRVGFNPYTRCFAHEHGWSSDERVELGAAPSLADYGLTQQAADAYAMDAVSATTGIPVATLNNIANTLSSGDPAAMAEAADVAILTALGGPVTGAAFGAIIDLATWLNGGNPPASQYSTNFVWPCDMPGCPPTGNPACIAYGYTDLYDPGSWGWAGMVPGTFMHDMSAALMADWDTQMQPSTDPHDIGVCGRTVKGINPVDWAQRHLASSFPMLLAAWNATHLGPSAPLTWNVRQTLNILGVDSYDVPGGEASLGQAASINPVSVALNELAISAGLPADSTVTGVSSVHSTGDCSSNSFCRS